MIVNLRNVLTTIQGATAYQANGILFLRRGQATVSCDLKGLDRASLADLFRGIAGVLDDGAGAGADAKGDPQVHEDQLEFDLEASKPPDVVLGTYPTQQPTKKRRKK